MGVFMSEVNIDGALDKFRTLIVEQLERVNQLNNDTEWIDYSKKDVLEIGICWGDGIGKSITTQAQRVLEYVLADAIKF